MTSCTTRRFATVFLILFLLALPECGWLGDVKVQKAAGLAAQVGDTSPTNPIVPTPNTSGAALTLNIPGPTVVNQCTVGLVGYLFNGQAAAIPSATTVDIVGPAPSGLTTVVTLFNSTNCDPTTVAATNTLGLSMPAQSSSAQFSMKLSLTGTFNVAASVVTGSPATGTNASVQVNPIPTPSVPTKLIIGGSPQVNAGSCSGFTATLEDINNIPTSFTGASVLGVGGGGAGALFYTDSACTISTSSIPVPALTPVTSFFLKPITAGVTAVTGNFGNINGSFTVDIVGLAPNHLTIVATNPINSKSCKPVTIAIRDLYENSVGLPNTQNAVVTTAGPGAFYSDNNCSIPISNVPIAANASGNANNSLFYSSPIGGSDTLSATVGSLKGSLSITIVAAGSLVINNPPSGSVTNAGICYGPYTVDVLDGFGKVLSPPPSVNVQMKSASGKGLFFNESSCGTVSGTSAGATVLSTAPRTSFFYLDFRAESLTITANDAANLLGQGSQPLTVLPGQLSQLIVSGQSGQIAAGTCSQFLATYADSYGNPIAVTAPSNINISETGVPGKFFSGSDPNCQTAPLGSSPGPITLALNTGDVAKYFYFQSTTAGSGVMNATGGIYTAPGFNFNITAGPPTHIKEISAPVPVVAGVCAAPFVFGVFDQFENPTTTLVNTTFTITTSGGTFYSSSDCSNNAGTLINSINFPAGTGRENVSYKGTVIGNVIVSIVCTGYNPTLTFNFTLVSGGPAQLAFNGLSPLPKTGPSTAPVQVIAGQCLPFSVSVLDAIGNATTSTSFIPLTGNVSGIGGGTFYSDACATPLTSSFGIPANTGSIPVWFKPLAAGNAVLSAQSTGFTPVSYAVSISGAAAAKLVITGPSASPGVGTAGVCAGPFQVTGVDAFGNPTSLPGVTIGLAQTGAGSANGKGNFFSGSGCTQSINTITMVSPYVSGPFWFEDLTAESLTLTASATNLTPGALGFLIQPNVPEQIIFTGPTTVAAGVCSDPLTFQVVDHYGNLTIDSVNDRIFTITQPTMSGSGLTLTSDCTTVITTMTLPKGGTVSGPLHFQSSVPYTNANPTLITQTSPPAIPPSIPIQGTVHLTVTAPLGPCTAQLLAAAPNCPGSPGTIHPYQGQQVTLTWSTSNCASCNILGANVGTSNSSGYSIVNAPVGTTSYTLSCTGYATGSSNSNSSTATTNATSTVSLIVRSGTISYSSPFDIRTVERACTASTPDQQIYDQDANAGSGVVQNDSASAARICWCQGYGTVSNHSDSWNGRTGYTSPGNNTLGYWNGSKWIIGNAETLGNKWLATLNCASPLPTCN